MKDISKFIFEVGTLKRIKRGWLKSEGVSNPESVAEHTYRNTIIGYILAKLENADVEKVVKMCLFHDVPEVRIGDVDKVAQHYINKDKAELEALKDQVKNLPENMSEEMLSLMNEFFEGTTKEATIAKDADRLELIFQAKEYADRGHTGCLYWIEKHRGLLKTESAKKLCDEAVSMNSTEWWKGLENVK